MAADQLVFPSMTQMLLSDPVFLIGITVPFLLLGAMVWYRMRQWRRVTALATRNERRYDEAREQSATQWQDSAERQERMIALLTEIRDHIARIPLSESAAGSGQPDSNS